MPTIEASIAQDFNRYFRVVFADSNALLDQAQHIRYRVYCEEFRYERREDCPGERERDAYDQQSTHCLIIHRRSEVAAGCVRIVPTLEEAPEALLPFEKNCGESLDKRCIEQLALDRSHICEISRLAVDRQFRRRIGEKATRFGRLEQLNFSDTEKRTLPFIAIAAYLAATAITHHSGRTDVFAMMEPFLPRLLARAGIQFARVGNDIDYHGIRAPYFIRTQSALRRMKPELKKLYSVVERDLYISETTDMKSK